MNKWLSKLNVKTSQENSTSKAIGEGKAIVLLQTG